jgi:flavin-dependent thymidylate synthase
MSSSFAKAQANKQNAYIPKWVEIVNIEYVGVDDTYDLEVNNSSHNYIANGIVVHNSQRYADPTQDLEFCLRECRLQDTKNRQNSIALEEDAYSLVEIWKQMQLEIIEKAKMHYQYAVSQGIAKEVARVILPEGNTVSRIYMNASLRTWIHFLEVRTGNGTQKEHMMVARACSEAIYKIFPHIK